MWESELASSAKEHAKTLASSSRNGAGAIPSVRLRVRCWSVSYWDDVAGTRLMFAALRSRSVPTSIGRSLGERPAQGQTRYTVLMGILAGWLR